MASLIQRPNGVYYIQYCVSGKARRVTTGTDSVQIAREGLRQFESAQFRRDDLPLPTRTPIAQVVARYVAHIRTRKKAKTAQTDIYYFREAFGPICEALTVTSRRLSRREDEFHFIRGFSARSTTLPMSATSPAGGPGTPVKRGRQATHRRLTPRTRAEH